MTRPFNRCRFRRSLLPAAILPALMVLPVLPQDAASSGGSADEIARTREAMRLWVETSRTISAEERDWRLAKDLLESRIVATTREIEERRKDIAEAEASITDSDRKRLELVAENDRLKEGTTVLEEIIAGFEARTRSLLKRLPDPIRDRLKPITVQIPEDPATTELDLGRRYLNVIGVLNEIDKFNREVSEYSEIRQRPDGSTAEVVTVYFGLGQAFYLGRDGKTAGVGRPGPDGWVWTELDGSIPAITELVAIVRNETPAAYVELPLVID
jgi:hypothetical protein